MTGVGSLIRRLSGSLVGSTENSSPSQTPLSSRRGSLDLTNWASRVSRGSANSTDSRGSFDAVIYPGAIVEAADDRQLSTVHGVLQPAQNSAGFWYQCMILNTTGNDVSVRLDGPEGPTQKWLSRSLVRRCCQADKALKAAQLQAGTMVEVQIPDKDTSSPGTDEAWAWCPGVVQVYDGMTLPPGHVVVALDLAASSEGPRQVIVPASTLRVVLRCGWRVRVEGAGVAEADGVYEAVGFHDGAPRFECGEMALLRFRLPSGPRFWYLAHKSKLERNDGDLYRIRSSFELPPVTRSTPVTRQRSLRLWNVAKEGGDAAIPLLTWVPGLSDDDSITSEDTFAVSPSRLEEAGGANQASPMSQGSHSRCSSSFSAQSSEDGFEDAELSDEGRQGGGGGGDRAGGRSCAVCLDAAAEYALIPCGHLCLCGECSFNLRDNTPQCPVCRKPSLYTQRIFA